MASNDTPRLAGQVALITGGASGLGFGFAQDLARHGVTVALMGRDHARLTRAVDELRSAGEQASGHVGDVSSEADIERVLDAVLEAHGALHVVINNAGVADEAAFLDIAKENWDQVLATNLTGPFLVTQRAAARMAQGGAVVNITSIDAYGADGLYSSYVAAKAGLIGLTKAAAVELAPRGIRVNSVSPGWTLTEMAVDSVSPTMLDQMKSDFARVPMRRMLRVEEVAAAVTFLASPAAAGITGIDVSVDGGTLANLFILETLDNPPSDIGSEHA
jgi:NAD(P)-dependent dehydrogenase (short-subunit alcohol dehydrogenase family)